MALTWARFVASSRIVDVVVVVATLVFAVTAIATSESFEPTALYLAVVVAGCVATWWRLRYPGLVLVIALVTFLVTGTPALLMLAMATFADEHGARLPTWIAVVGSTVVVAVHEVDALDSLEPWLLWSTVICLPTAVGLVMNSRRMLLQEAVDKANRLESAQAALAQEVRGDERARIAREMHDVVAHQVSLIALHAGALELAEQGTPAAETAALIRQTARRALEELRGVVGVLRTKDQGAEREPQPTATRINDLVDGWRAAGTDVTLEDRTLPGFLPGLSGTAGRTACRVIEESLTNVSKHAPGSHVSITLDRCGDDLQVEVRNTAGTRVSSRARSGGGTGLIGLRERVELLGGHLETGPDQRGGFQVRAVVAAGPGSAVEQ